MEYFCTSTSIILIITVTFMLAYNPNGPHITRVMSASFATIGYTSVSVTQLSTQFHKLQQKLHIYTNTRVTTSM